MAAYSREMAREAEIGVLAGRRELDGSAGEHVGAAGEARELGRQRLLAGRLQMSGIAVVPAAVEAPEVAHDELRVVVDRTKVGPREQLWGRGHRVDDVFEPRTLVHESEGLGRERLEQCGRVDQHGPDPIRSGDRQPVAGQQQLRRRFERRHLPQRGRPVLGIPLHLLGIAGVGRAPDDEVAGAQGSPFGDPHPRVVVCLAAGVVQLGGDATEVEVEAVGVRHIRPAVLDRPLQPGRAELPLVDHGVVAGGLHVPVEAGLDPGMADHAHGPFGFEGRGTEDVVDVAVRVHRG